MKLRTTVRKAISNLVNEGMLESVSEGNSWVRLKEVKYNFFGTLEDFLIT